MVQTKVAKEVLVFEKKDCSLSKRCEFDTFSIAK